MKKGLIIGIIIVLLIIGGSIFFLNSDDESSLNSGDSNKIPSSNNNANVNEDQGEQTRPEDENPPIVSEPKTHTIEMRDSGFSPSSLEINQGDTVNFVNLGTRDMWPASNAHPTHTIYPGSNINKCNSAEENSIFDACGDISPGESYSFTFNVKGTWSYHDHKRASMGGTIVVK